MSHNLYLIGDFQELDLVQTPTYITDDAMKLYYTGNTGLTAAKHAFEVYHDYLLGLVEQYDWDAEEVESRITEVMVFLLFAPGARFVSS